MQEEQDLPYAPLDALKLFRAVRFQRVFVDWCGSINGALFLSQLVYWSEKTSNPEGWVHKTIQQWEGETGLSRHEQLTARRALLDAELLEEKKEGMPGKMFFRLARNFFTRLDACCRLEPGRHAGRKSANTLAANSPRGKHTVQHTLHLQGTSRDARAPEKNGDYSFGLGKKQEELPYHLEAAKLVEEFYQYLVEKRLHLARADLPRGQDTLSKSKRDATFRKWTRFASELLEQFDGYTEPIRAVMKWYFQNYRNKGVGAYHSMNTFCENYHKLKKSMSWKENIDDSERTIETQNLGEETLDGCQDIW